MTDRNDTFYTQSKTEQEKALQNILATLICPQCHTKPLYVHYSYAIKFQG